MVEQLISNYKMLPHYTVTTATITKIDSDKILV